MTMAIKIINEYKDDDNAGDYENHDGNDDYNDDGKIRWK